MYVYLKVDGVVLAHPTVQMLAVPRVGDTFYLINERIRLIVTGVEWAAEGGDGTVSPLLTCEPVECTHG